MRIGVIRFSSMGDIVLTGPSLRGLRTRFPGARISFITTEPYAELAAVLPGVDRVSAIPRRGRPFRKAALTLAEAGWDYIADLQGSPRSALLGRMMNPERHIVDRPPRFRRSLMVLPHIRVGSFLPVPERQLKALARWGVEDDGGGLELEIPPAVREEVVLSYPVLREKPFIFIPGAAHATKRWPAGYWIELFRRLKLRRPVVVIGGQGDLPGPAGKTAAGSPEFHDLTGKTSILRTAAILQHAGAVVSGDTGPMHLAVAVGAPLVALFGPTVREFGFYPFRAPRATVIEKRTWCRPCSAHGADSCLLRHHRCMRKIEPGEVALAAVRLLEEGEA